MGILESLASAGNVTQPANMTAPALELMSTSGIAVFVVGALLVIVTAYIMYRVVKELIVNSIIGGVGLIAMHFLFPYIFDIEVDISILNIVIAIIAGVPGLVIIVLRSLFGI